MRKVPCAIPAHVAGITGPVQQRWIDRIHQLAAEHIEPRIRFCRHQQRFQPTQFGKLIGIDERDLFRLDRSSPNRQIVPAHPRAKPVF